MTSTTSPAVQQQPASRLLPYDPSQPGGQFAVAGDHVADVGRAEERGIDGGGGREQRGNGDQAEAELSQEGLGGFSQRVILGALDLRIRQISRHGDRHDEIERDDEDHADIERARQHGSRITHVGGGVGHEPEALVADEQHAARRTGSTVFPAIAQAIGSRG